MAASTSGSDDRVSNQCGIATSHAYSIITVFNMTDEDGTYQMALMRNPWNINKYNFTWSRFDKNWTLNLLRQVPFGFNPIMDMGKSGLFVVPMEAFKNEYCFD